MSHWDLNVQQAHLRHQPRRLSPLPHPPGPGAPAPDPHAFPGASRHGHPAHHLVHPGPAPHRFLGLKEPGATGYMDFWHRMKARGVDGHAVIGLLESLPSRHGQIGGWYQELDQKGYLYGLEVPEDYAGPVPEGMVCEVIDAGDYAVFHHPAYDFERQDAQVYAALHEAMAAWQPEDHGFLPDDTRPTYQRHGSDTFGQAFCRPIRKATEGDRALISDLEQSVLVSLDGTDPRLYRHLPELLQDLDDLGAEPRLISRLLEAHRTALPPRARILDLGCGKGSVSLHLLQQHPWTALGLDGMPAFVDRAQARAQALGLADRASFVCADLRTWPGEGCFDLVILGALGPILGDTATTLRHIAPWLSPGGLVILDEVYVPDGTLSRNAAYNRDRASLEAALAEAGFRLLGEEDGASEDNPAMFEAIRRRAEDLAQRHPEDRAALDAYVAQQAQEFELLDGEIIATTLLLARA